MQTQIDCCSARPARSCRVFSAISPQVDQSLCGRWRAGVVQKRLQRSIQSLDLFIEHRQVAGVEAVPGRLAPRGIDDGFHRRQRIAKLVSQSRGQLP